MRPSNPQPVDPAHGESPPKRFSYGTLAAGIIGLGVFLIAAPDYWYGPSWSYFSDHRQLLLPAGGTGMGTCLVLIGVLQLLAVRWNKTRYLPTLFFLSGFVFWVSGILLGAEGILGHRGLMEAPFMLALGIHKFMVMANISVDQRAAK